MSKQTYSFKFSTSWEEIKSFDPYLKHKQIAKDVVFLTAFIALEIASNLYVPSIVVPAFTPDSMLLDTAAKAFKGLKVLGL